MFAAYDVAVIPIIVGLVELLKGVGLPKKWCPVASVVLGIVGGVVYLCPSDVKMGIISGLVIGLSASGLYSSGKNMVNKNEEDGLNG